MRKSKRIWFKVLISTILYTSICTSVTAIGKTTIDVQNISAGGGAV